jgi:hypothetical protein
MQLQMILTKMLQVPDAWPYGPSELVLIQQKQAQIAELLHHGKLSFQLIGAQVNIIQSCHVSNRLWQRSRQCCWYRHNQQSNSEVSP